MNSQFLTEAFKELELLNEEDFSLDKDGIDDLGELINSEDDIIDIIDADAETEEEIEDSYVGKVVLDCCVCHSKIYKNADSIVIDEEDSLANKGEECPYCYSVDGYKILGQIAPYEEEAELKVEVEDKDSDGDVDEIKVSAEEDEEKKVEESLKKAKRANIVKECKNTKKYHKAITLKEEDEIEGFEDKIEEVVASLSDEAVEELTTQMIADYILDNIDDEEVQEIVSGIEEQIPAEEDDKEEVKVEDEIVEEGCKGKKCGKKSVKESVYKKAVYRKKFNKRLQEAVKKSNGRKPLKESYYDVFEDLKDRAISEMEEGNDKDEAIMRAIDDGLIYTRDIIDVAWHYGAINDSELFERFYEELFDDLYGAIDYEPEEEVEESLDKKKNVKEGFEKVELETEDKVIKVSEEEKQDVPDGEMIEPLDVETEKEIVDSTNDENEFEPEEGAEDEFVDQDFEEFGEEEFNDLGESYLKKVYDNVKSFKTASVLTNGNTLKLEGIIEFNSGNKKATTFLFEAKDITKRGKVRFVGENCQISKGKKSFTLTGSISNNKLIAESLNYNYRAKGADGKSVRLYGTVRKA